MSWMKRAQGGAPPAADQTQYDAPQPYGNQHNMYPNYQGTPSNITHQQQQYWQQQQQQQQQQQPAQPQYNQQYGQMYQQQNYANNANQYYQQPTQYNQSFSSQNYNNTQQAYQHNYYPNQSMPQQSYPQNKVNSDGWEDNWDWGWEDSSKQKPVTNQIAQQLNTSQGQQVCANANVIEESFASTNTWNWAMEDKKEPQEQSSTSTREYKELAQQPSGNKEPNLNSQTEHIMRGNISSPSQPEHSSSEVKTLSDKDVKERLPNLALGKRFHLENLTPQWSIESQMSQESSDGPHTHSEGTYRSENQSRNSSKSSPGPNTDTSNFNYSQSRIDEMYPQSTEWSSHSNEDSTKVDSHKDNSSRRQSHELSTSLQDMSISNTDNVVSDAPTVDNELEPSLPPPLQPAPSISSAELAQPRPDCHPSLSSCMPPPPPVSVASNPPAAMASGTLPPPTSFPPPSSSQNPFKHAGPFSHKNISKNHSNIPPQPFPPQMANTNLTSPSVVSKISHSNRIPVGFGANLETTPDNSERPDQPQAAVAGFVPLPVSQQIPDNMEVAPQHDRNEYLQTEHLSSVDFGENTDFSQNDPPPGLRRMVVGQQEAEYSQNLNISGDEPPPGLARMVPGQQTESDEYNQSNDNYMDRHVDGQITDNSGHPFRQADGQQTPDNYSQPPPNRGSDRRPIGLDRMVPGEPSNNEYMQYQAGNYGGSNEPRVVTGVDHDYPLHVEAGPPEVREQNVDGSDYTEPAVRNPTRNVIGLREATNDSSVDFVAAPGDQQRERELTMEGENLQDLSVISGAEMTFSREQMFDVVSGNVTDLANDASESVEYPASGSRRQSVNRVNTSEDSERDRTFKSSPRRDRDKQKSSRDRDRDRERDKDGRYSRGDKKYDRDPDRKSGRDGRRSEKDRRDRDREGKERVRRERDGSPDAPRQRRSARGRRYDTEDTDYYSDRERERRRYREGSYTSKPPRPDDKERRRYNTTERDRYDDDGGSRRRADRHRDRPDRSDRMDRTDRADRSDRPERADRSDRMDRTDRADRSDRMDRTDRRYRDIDPARKYGNLRREQEERRRGETYSSPSRAGSREATATDEEPPVGERRRRDRDRDRRWRSDRSDRADRADHDTDPYYLGGYGAYGGAYGDPFLLQRQQYSYYERLRRTDPAAYMRLYKQLMAAPHAPHAPHAPYADVAGYGALGYEARGEERASGHSGRSSVAALTAAADTELNTDASLNLQLEESTVRSERMTPFKYSTAHVKGTLSARHVVVVRAAYPADGRPATVQLVPLGAATARLPDRAHLLAYPGPLVRGVTHKKSVIEYCLSRAAETAGAGGAGGEYDPLGQLLVWELLALLLRQNGVVVGTDIAELLMKNAREHEFAPSPRPDSRAASSAEGEGHDTSPACSDRLDAQMLTPSPEDVPLGAEGAEGAERPAVSEAEALARLREYLIYGNRQEAFEWAMRCGLWGHALQLAGERRARAALAARFLAGVPARDPLHTLYAALGARMPPAAAGVAEERWGDWRPHAAILLANAGARPDIERRALTQLGDSLASRGLVFSAQFCYLSGGVPFAPHPLAPLQPRAAPVPTAPPRLSLLLADPRAASLQRFATNRAIFATEIYEYALSLSHEDYVIEDFQVYKVVAASRLADAGQCERALGYAERAARAVTRAPRRYPRALPAALARLAAALHLPEPALHDDPPLLEEPADPALPASAEPSPRHHQWIQDLADVASALEAEAWRHGTPQHQPDYQQQPIQYEQNEPAYPEPAGAELAQQYYQPPDAQRTPQHAAQPGVQPGAHDLAYAHLDPPLAEHAALTAPAPASAPLGEEWGRAEQPAHSYADPYWPTEHQYGYGDGAPGDGDAEPRPTITMPGSAPARPAHYAHYEDDAPPAADAAGQEEREGGEQEGKGKEEGGKAEGKGKAKGGWLGGILTKLSLRPPNQMILPDDSNPTIVWDAEHKRWRNLEADGEEAPRAPPPPPARTAPAPAPAPGAPPIANIFKMQKGRHIKKSYVDVFNPSGAATRPLPPAAEVLGAPPPAAAAAPHTYFVPAPMAAQGYYDPSQGEELPL